MPLREDRAYLSEQDIYCGRSNTAAIPLIEFDGKTIAVHEIVMIIPTVSYTILLALKNDTGRGSEPILELHCRSRERMLHEYDKLRYCLQNNLISVTMTDDYNERLAARER